MHMAHAHSASGLYPMRLVTRLTGLSADTIRAWERRHGAVTPSRSSGNTRRFTADEVRRLLLLKEATEVGHSIRTIAPLGLSELEGLVERQSAPLEVVSTGTEGASENIRELRRAYLGALSRFEVRRGFDLLMRGATFLDRHTFVFEIVLPLFAEVRDRWPAPAPGSVQERLVSDQVRAVLMTLLRLSPPPTTATRVLLATLEGQHHVGELLVAGLLASAHGKDPVHVGSGMSVDDIEWAVKMSRAHVLFLATVSELNAKDFGHLAALSDGLRPDVQVWCSIPSGHPLVSKVEMDAYFHDFENFVDALKGLS